MTNKVKTMLKIKNLKTKMTLTAIYAGIILVMKIFNLPCIYMYLFNFPCPGCGMTRAVSAALMLDFETAFMYHGMFWAMPLVYIHFLYDHKLFGNVWDKIFLGLVGAGFVVNYIVKINAFLS